MLHRRHQTERYVERVEIACDQFQLLDVQRIDYLRDVLLKYEDAERSLPPKMNEALVRFMATVEAVDPSVDTRAFVEAKRLNSVPRPPWPYVEIIQSRMNGMCMEMEMVMINRT